MLNLGTGQKLYGSSSAGNIPFSIAGRYDTSTAGSAQVVKQGYVKPVTAVLYTPTNNFILSSIHIQNTTGVSTDIVLSVNAGDASGRIYRASLGINYTLTLDIEGWKIYDASGIQRLSSVSSAVLSDGDYGDVTVSGGGTVITIDPGLSATVIGSGNIDNTEFDYLDGTTSNIQIQIDTLADDMIALAASL